MYDVSMANYFRFPAEQQPRLVLCTVQLHVAPRTLFDYCSRHARTKTMVTSTTPSSEPGLLLRNLLGRPLGHLISSLMALIRDPID